MFVGDSSGGNLALTASMKLKEMGVRLPDAMLIVYPSTNVSTAACPSRIISMVDPILPLGVLVACQQVRCVFCMCIQSELHPTLVIVIILHACRGVSVCLGNLACKNYLQKQCLF